MGTIRLAVLLVLLAVGAASANCPDQRASCLLHEEGVALLMEKNYQAAATKFAAAIAAEPTARSYLGYAQSVEALGQIPLAYDSLVAAQRLSQAEVQANPKDAEVSARAERIKYKLGELRAKIGFVWLRLPPNVPPQRVIGVQREGEGQLAAPFTQWTAVAPGKQVLIATLDDGTKQTVVAEVAAGSQGVVVIPVPVVAGRTQPVRTAGMPAPAPMPAPEPPSKPIYKKWWFWTLIVIGVVVVISATSGNDSASASTFRFDRPLPPAPPAGATIFRF